MFRRLLMDALRPFGDVVAILYSGIAFGLLHMNFQQLFYAAGVGLIFGYVMVKTNNIWYCIGLHAALNTTSAIILPFMDGVDLNNPDLQSTSFIAVGFFVGVLLVISVTGIVLFFANIKKIRVEGPRFRFSVPVGGKQALINAGTIPYILICIAISVYRITIL
ncbi:MAG: CPBP family intramembrane metalloprotease, partial [Oscillospiraceae bacterium]|nr:CPBP family intramembrane metalloprotease [Oscillospiraceae bacterium]